MIVFDIEWNHGCDDIPLDEILEIGAVRLDRSGGKITDTFHVYIHPRVHQELGIMAREVLDLRPCQASELNFAQALAAFAQWCGQDRVFAAWGNSDMEVLRRNCEYWKAPVPQPEVVYDIQSSFSAVAGAKQHIALYRAVEYCGIPDCFDCHDALYDAVYTAIIAMDIPVDLLLPSALPKRLRRLSRSEFPVQQRRRVGPFSSPEAALNSRDCRRVECPHCGRKIWINTWHCHIPGRYYADFCCPEHGWHICRATLFSDGAGAWRGRVAVPAMTQNLMWEFHAATKDEHYICTTAEKKHKRRRRKRKRTAEI